MGFDQGPKIGVPTFPKGKAAKLSLEHINDIAELSSTYLNCEAVEFSEGELAENLYLLSVVAKKVKHSMAKKDVDKIGSLSDAIFGNPKATPKK